MKEEPPPIWNLSNPAEKQRLLLQISRLSGLQEVRIRPRKRTRTLNQNSYYWVAVVGPFTEWLREQYGDPLINAEQAHEMLKVKILGVEQKIMENGEILTLIPRSKTLNTDHFAAYIEKCAEWLSEFCEIVVIPSELFWESK